MKRIALYTKNPHLARRFQLVLRNIASVDVINEEHVEAKHSEIFIDRDTFPDISIHGVEVSTSGKHMLRVPFPHEELISLVTERSTESARILTLSATDKYAALGDERIKLTDVEYRLLAVLLSSEDFIKRETLLSSVWGDGTDIGVVNVYIHYLREKLEAHGEKIILSSRKEGYMIDKRYRGAGKC